MPFVAVATHYTPEPPQFFLIISQCLVQSLFFNQTSLPRAWIFITNELSPLRRLFIILIALLSISVQENSMPWHEGLYAVKNTNGSIFG